MKNIFILSTMVFLAACGANNQRNLAMDGNPSIADGNGSKGEGSLVQDIASVIKACFSGNCFSLVDKSKLATPNEYKYRNPAGSFSAATAKQYRAPSRFIDLLNTSNPSNVSANFKATEYMSASKGRYGILSPLVAANIQSIRQRLGKAVTITSGFRSPSYNAKIDGSATWSRHQYGDGIDFKVAGLKPSQLKKYCTDLGASYTQLYVGHIHCDWRLKPLPQEFYPTTTVAQKAELEQNAAVLQREIHDHFRQNIEIFVEGDLSAGSQARFYIDSAVKEDEDALYVEWKVSLNGEVISENDDSILNLQNLAKGSYRIDAVVGGNSKVFYSFEVK